MFLPWLFIILITVQLCIRFSIVTELQSISLFLHHLCLSQVPPAPLSQATLSALVCGKNFDRLSDTQIYTSTGLIHLFVVSGSHLILIQKLLNQISPLFFKKINYAVLLLVLLTYAAMCLFNPPVTRSFIFLFFSITLHRRHQYWPKHYVLLIAGLATLALNYQWMTSMSLQMSWLAALVLEIYAQKFSSTSFFVRQLIFYSLFIVCYMGLGFPQLSTIIVCVVLTPALEYILFPFAILTVMFHPFEPLFSGLLMALNTLLKSFEFYSRPSFLEVPTVTYLNWLIIFICHFLLFFRKPRT